MPSARNDEYFAQTITPATCLGQLLALTLGLSALAGGAQEPSQWQTHCQLSGDQFEVGLASASGDLDQTDMLATLRFSDGDQLPLGLRAGIFHPRGVVANKASGCAELGAFELTEPDSLAPGNWLLLLSVDDRPGFDQLSLVLIDPRQRQVIDRSEYVAPFKDPDGRQQLAVRVDRNQLLIRLQRRWLHDTDTDSAENSIEDWYRLQVVNQRIRGRWAD